MAWNKCTGCGKELGTGDVLGLCWACRYPMGIPSPSPEPFKRYAKYEVMKLEDIDKYLTPTQKTNLDDIILSIHKGRVKNGKAPCNHYVVVNEDMPYAEQVWKLIEDYEMTGKPAPQPGPQPLEEAITKTLYRYGWRGNSHEVITEILQAIAASQQAETAAMRGALHRIYELIDINRPYCDRCDDIRDIVMKFEGGR